MYQTYHIQPPKTIPIDVSLQQQTRGLQTEPRFPKYTHMT